MKFFKKLSNNNTSGSNKKLLFLKNSKKDKDKKSKEGFNDTTNTETNSGEFFEFNLPNDFSSTLDISHVDQNDIKADSISNDITIDANKTPTAALTTTDNTTKDEFSTLVHQSLADPNVYLKNNTTYASLQSLDLKSINNNLYQEQEVKVEGVEINPFKFHGLDNTETNIQSDDRDYGESLEVKNQDLEKQECDLKEIKPNTETDSPTMFTFKQTNEESDDEEIQQDKNVLFSDSVEENSQEIVELESRNFTPQNGRLLDNISITNDSEIEAPEENTYESIDTTNETELADTSQTSSNNDKKKEVDKRKSSQSFIPRKQFQQTSKEEEKKRVEIKSKNRNNIGSTIPVLSSSTNSNKLIITTTLVVDTNNSKDNYYTPPANSSPLSTTSTSTSATSASDHSNGSAKKPPLSNKSKYQPQQQSKIPIASNIPSMKNCPIQTTGSLNHASRLPKKIKNVS